MKRFRVAVRDIKTGEMEHLDGFEAKSRDEVFARLNAAGMAVDGVEEIGGDGPNGDSASLDLMARVRGGVRAAQRSISEGYEVQSAIANQEREAREKEQAWRAAPRQRVLADLSFSAQINIAVGVFLGVVAAAIVLSMCGGVLGVLSAAAGAGR